MDSSHDLSDHESSILLDQIQIRFTILEQCYA